MIGHCSSYPSSGDRTGVCDATMNLLAYSPVSGLNDPRQLIMAVTEHYRTSRGPTSASSDRTGTGNLPFEMRWVADVFDFTGTGDRDFECVAYRYPRVAGTRHRNFGHFGLQRFRAQITRPR